MAGLYRPRARAGNLADMEGGARMKWDWRYLAQIVVAYLCGVLALLSHYKHEPWFQIASIVWMMTLPWWRE